MTTNISMNRVKVSGKMTKRSVSRAENAVKILMEEEIARLAMFKSKNKFTDL